MHAAGGPDAFLDEHAVIVTSDHSQAAVEERIRLDRAFAEFDVATRSAARSAGAEVALSPAQRAAMIYALDFERRDELVERSVEAVREVEGVDLVLWLAGPDVRRRRSSAAGAESFGSPRGIRWSGRSRRSLERRGRPGRAARRGPGRALPVQRVSGRACAHLVGAEMPDRRRRPAVGLTRLRVRRLGRRRPRRRRQPRLAAPLRFARRAAVVRHRPGVRIRARALVAPRRRADGPRAFCD